MKHIATFLAWLLSLFILAGCQNDDAPKETEDAPSTVQASVVELSEAKFQRANLAFATVTYEPIEFLLTVPAEIFPMPNSEAFVGSLVAGRIKSVGAKLSQFVQAGAPLAVLESAEIGAATADLKQCAAELEVAESDLRRKASLSDENIISGKALAEAEARLKIAKASLYAAESRVAAIGFSSREIEDMKKNPDTRVTSVGIRAPISGFLSARSARIGEYVLPEQTLFKIHNLSKVMLVGSIFEPDFHKVAEGQKVEVFFGENHREKLLATIESVGTTLDEVTHALSVRAVLQNPDYRLKPSMHAEMWIHARAKEPAFLLPAGAVGIDGEKKFVFVRKAERVFEQRTVVPLYETQAQVALSEGVGEGETVVSEGVFFLKSEIKASEMEE
ncbi:efflux transporter, RND family, MFP subunit [Chloroherpeton thalassium ATCC 35110]|uniref:Efflux transporter, RND family, MFP subunit n=1 Tax=Chloroherpeton thalassium (strain ATCC 35110 / GB-78) TaxID=517418 RepID=B3QUI0_CHLT3|nr:efflux RND transporter periplasmic adaptor subunit [Chloroherpeton thalassium]ACF12886.1 efflux transporter, RND family, MFP subunit [Chloroherpeton thalassium ATCC 35110]